MIKTKGVSEMKDIEIDKELDDLILKFGKMVQEDEAKRTTPDEEREQMVKDVCEITQEIVTGENVKVTYKLHEPFPSSGYVEVRGKDITVKRPDILAEIMKLAVNIDVCCLANGDVVMNIGFSGLTK